MPTSITIGFDGDQHLATNNGWVLSYADGTGGVTTQLHATLTAAHAAAKTLYSDDPSIHAVLQSQTSSEFVTVPANVTTINTNTSTKRVAEGLDGPYP